MSGRTPSPTGRRPDTGWRRVTEAFGSPQFRWMFSSNMLFFLAMGGQSAVRPWLAFELTDSELALGIPSAAAAIPMLALAPFGGALADRLEGRGMILRAQAIVTPLCSPACGDPPSSSSASTACSKRRATCSSTTSGAIGTAGSSGWNSTMGSLGFT